MFNKLKKGMSVLASAGVLFTSTCTNSFAVQDYTDNIVVELRKTCEKLLEEGGELNGGYVKRLEEILERYASETKWYIDAANFLFEDMREYYPVEKTPDDVDKNIRSYMDYLERTGQMNYSELEYLKNILSHISSETDAILKDIEDICEEAEQNLKKVLESIRRWQEKCQTTLLVLNKHVDLEVKPQSESNMNGNLKIPPNAYVADCTFHNIYNKGNLVDMVECDKAIFEHRPNPNDIVQGRIGDCYFLAALASICNRRPEVIEDSIIDNADGTVTVKFFHVEDGGREVRPCYYKVDKAVDSERIKEGCSPWVLYFEKAYLFHKTGGPVVFGEHKQDFNKIYGGSPRKALTEISGKDADEVMISIDKGKLSHDVGNYSQESMDVFERIKELHDTSCMCTYITTHDYCHDGLYRIHAYAVIDVLEKIETKTGKKLNLLVLRNPWGDGVPEYEKDEQGTYCIKKCYEAKNGVFVLDLNDFLRSFNIISCCSIQ